MMPLPGSPPNADEQPAHWWARALALFLAVAVAFVGMAVLPRLRSVEREAEERLSQVAALRAEMFELEGSYGYLAVAVGKPAQQAAALRTQVALSRSLARHTAAAYPGSGANDAHDRRMRALVARVRATAADAIAAWKTNRIDRAIDIALDEYAPAQAAANVAMTADLARLERQEDGANRQATLSTLTVVATMLLLIVGIGVASRRHDRRRERARRREVIARERWFRTVIDHSGDLVLVLDEKAIIRFVGPGAPELLGFEYDEVIGRDVADFMVEGDVARFLPMWADLVERPGANARLDVRLRHKEGADVEVEAICRNLLDDDVVRGVVCNTRDVTARRRLEQQLVHRAFRDELTGLPNRAELIDRLEHALSVASRLGERVAVLFLDLDGFKTVNDTLGHAAGDELLVTVARRLRGALRPSDTAARLAGDEFVVLVEDVDDEADAFDAATRIVGEIARPTTVHGQELCVGVSVGIAFGDAACGAADLLRKADTAMYEAKTSGRGAIVLFEPAMADRAWSRLQRAGEAEEREPDAA